MGQVVKALEEIDPYEGATMRERMHGEAILVARKEVNVPGDMLRAERLRAERLRTERLQALAKDPEPRDLDRSERAIMAMEYAIQEVGSKEYSNALQELTSKFLPEVSE